MFKANFVNLNKQRLLNPFSFVYFWTICKQPTVIFVNRLFLFTHRHFIWHIFSIHLAQIEALTPPFEINDSTAQVDQSFAVGFYWRILMLCVSCDWLYTISSSTVLAETVVLSKVWSSTVLLYTDILLISVNIGTVVSFGEILINICLPIKPKIYIFFLTQIKNRNHIIMTSVIFHQL